MGECASPLTLLAAVASLVALFAVNWASWNDLFHLLHGLTQLPSKRVAGSSAPGEHLSLSRYAEAASVLAIRSATPAKGGHVTAVPPKPPATIDIQTLVPTARPLTLGNPVIPGMTTDAGSDLMFVDAGTCFKTAGKLTKVRFFAGNESRLDFRFQIYRLIDAGRSVYKLIAETQNIFVPRSGVEQSYALPTPLLFGPADCVGWANTGPGTIAWNFDGHQVHKKFGRDPVGTNVEFETLQRGRTYSYAVEYIPLAGVRTGLAPQSMQAQNTALAGSESEPIRKPQASSSPAMSQSSFPAPSASAATGCHRRANTAPWNVSDPMHRRIAIVLRGESYRAPVMSQVNLNDYTNDSIDWRGKQYGIYKRLTCAPGSKSLQMWHARELLKMVGYFESKNFTVHVYGVTYACATVTAKSAGFTVQSDLATYYKGRMRDLRILDKTTSQQITGIREGFRLVGEHVVKNGFAYDYVISIRWDNNYKWSLWSCLLETGQSVNGDLQSLEGVGNNDNLLVVGKAYLPCFLEFTQLPLDSNGIRNPRCCFGFCGGGDCHPCIKNFMDLYYHQKVEMKDKRPCLDQATNGRGLSDLRQAMQDEERTEAEHVGRRALQDLGRWLADVENTAPLNNPSWLPKADRLCIDRTNKDVKVWKKRPVGPQYPHR